MRASTPKSSAQPSGEEPRRNEAVLEIHPEAIPDQAIQGLLDDLLVPLIVERVIENLTKSR